VKRRRAAFTLVEVLAAMAFMAILVPVLVSALSTANRGAITAERAAVAAQLAENKLNEALIQGTWSSGARTGDFGDEWPGYTWEIQSTNWTELSEFTELTLLVHYQVQGQDRSVDLSTLVSTSSTTQ
jgi:type II secretory pathway pseudopilin PulG